jgi:signal transduction histidine kinase
MGQIKEYQIFIVIATIIWLVFISFIFIFIFQYRKRKLLYDKEKELITLQYNQNLLNTNLEIKEQTMQDIGREIHDNVGQKLTLASIYANQLAFDKQYPQIHDRIAAISNIINESLSELRGLSKSLTHSNTEIKELNELIITECDRVNALNICQTTCVFNTPNLKLSSTVKNFIVRIMQEFIQNSLKHANCKNILLEFIYQNEVLYISAHDDGDGFDHNKQLQNPEKGIGLSNMKKRAALIGADLTISSEINKGTVLNLSIPANNINA